MKATIKDAPACLNTNDKAMWVLGYNEGIESAVLAKLREQQEPVAEVIRKFSLTGHYQESVLRWLGDPPVHGALLFAHPVPIPEDQPKFVVELPDDDEREVKVWWSEKHDDGMWHISVTVAAARSK